jgi:hypothetical protein
MSKAVKFIKGALNMRLTFCRPWETTWRWVEYIDF